MQQAAEQDSNRDSVTDQIDRKLAFLHSMVVIASAGSRNLAELVPRVHSAYWYGAQEIVEEVQNLIKIERKEARHG